MKHHYNRALKWILSPADSDLPLLDIFIISGLLTVFLTRAYLAIMNYPQVGGGGLHVAHMLWGGLALLIAFLYLLVALSPNKKIAGFIGGFGFGLFIDEIGKFITVDNDYFFKPAASLIIVSFILIWFALRVHIAKREDKPVLPPAEWPTQLYSQSYVYAWLIVQLIASCVIVTVIIFSDTETIPQILKVPYIAYFISLLCVCILLIMKKQLAAATTLRWIAVTTVLIITPVNFYINQFAAAVGFVLLILLVIMTSKNYHTIRRLHPKTRMHHKKL